MRESLETITVAIDGSPVTYFIGKTTAPRVYDGFGTITVHEYDAGDVRPSDSFRIVLIRSDSFKWQEGRYNSGLYYVTPAEYPNKTAIAATLWERLTQAKSAG